MDDTDKVAFVVVPSGGFFSVPVRRDPSCQEFYNPISFASHQTRVTEQRIFRFRKQSYNIKQMRNCFRERDNN